MTNILQNHSAAVLMVYHLSGRILALEAVRDAARTLVEECQGGMLAPSLGALAALESALSMEWKKQQEGQKPL